MLCSAISSAGRFAWPWLWQSFSLLSLLCFHCIAMSWAGRLPGLWQSYYSLSPSVSTALPQTRLSAWPGLGCGNLIVHFHHVFPLHCHKLGWGAWFGLGCGNLIVHFHHVFPLHCHKLGQAFRLALAEANILFTCSLSLHCHAGLASVKSFHSTALYQTCNLFSLMSCPIGLASVRFIYSRILH